ncbi:hypothetical protein Hanom_Chr01g00008911 [Helianthus anomalus]
MSATFFPFSRPTVPLPSFIYLTSHLGLPLSLSLCSILILTDVQINAPNQGFRWELDDGDDRRLLALRPAVLLVNFWSGC